MSPSPLSRRPPKASASIAVGISAPQRAGQKVGLLSQKAFQVFLSVFTVQFLRCQWVALLSLRFLSWACSEHVLPASPPPTYIPAEWALCFVPRAVWRVPRPPGPVPCLPIISQTSSPPCAPANSCWRVSCTDLRLHWRSDSMSVPSVSSRSLAPAHFVVSPSW